MRTATGHPASSRDARIGTIHDRPRAVTSITGVNGEIAQKLVKLGEKVRNLRNHGLEEGVSTRLLIYAGQLIGKGITPARACEAAVARPITDDPDMQRSIAELVKAIF